MDCCSEEKCGETELKEILNIRNIYYTWIDKWTVAAKKKCGETEVYNKKRNKNTNLCIKLLIF